MCFCFLFNFRLSFCKLLLIRLSCLKYNRQNWLQQTQETKHRTGCVAISAGDSGGRAGGRAASLFLLATRASGRAGGQAASLFLLATRVGGGGWITELVEHIGQRHSNIHTEQAATHYLATLATVHIASRAQMPP